MFNHQQILIFISKTIDLRSNLYQKFLKFVGKFDTIKTTISSNSMIYFVYSVLHFLYNFFALMKDCLLFVKFVPRDLIHVFNIFPI